MIVLTHSLDERRRWTCLATAWLDSSDISSSHLESSARTLSSGRSVTGMHEFVFLLRRRRITVSARKWCGNTRSSIGVKFLVHLFTRSCWVRGSWVIDDAYDKYDYFVRCSKRNNTTGMMTLSRTRSLVVRRHRSFQGFMMVKTMIFSFCANNELPAWLHLIHLMPKSQGCRATLAVFVRSEGVVAFPGAGFHELWHSAMNSVNTRHNLFKASWCTSFVQQISEKRWSPTAVWFCSGSDPIKFGFQQCRAYLWRSASIDLMCAVSCHWKCWTGKYHRKNLKKYLTNEQNLFTLYALMSGFLMSSLSPKSFRQEQSTLVVRTQWSEQLGCCRVGFGHVQKEQDIHAACVAEVFEDYTSHQGDAHEFWAIRCVRCLEKRQMGTFTWCSSSPRVEMKRTETNFEMPRLF